MAAAAGEMAHTASELSAQASGMAGTIGALATSAGELKGLSIALEEGAEVVVHAPALLNGAGENADLAAALEEEVEQRGDGGEEGFAAATVGPDGAVGGGGEGKRRGFGFGRG